MPCCCRSSDVIPGDHGTWLRVGEDGTICEQRYWDVWDYTEPIVGLSDEDIADRLLAELRVAVQLRNTYARRQDEHGNQLETRVPLLGHKFVALAMSIPTAVKSRNGSLKYILKRAVRGLIRDELIDRKNRASEFLFANGSLIG